MINKVILMGRLTRDPELRYTSTNKPVCSFDVAVASGYGDSQKTDFINCIAWNKAAEFLGKYFNKGMMVIVGGRISTRTWEGKDGKKNYVTEVIANELDFGETKKARGGLSPSLRTDYCAFCKGCLGILTITSKHMPASRT